MNCSVDGCTEKAQNKAGNLVVCDSCYAALTHGLSIRVQGASLSVQRTELVLGAECQLLSTEFWKWLKQQPDVKRRRKR